MDLIKIVDAKTGEPMGTMNWFSVHATSMKSTSGLISGAWWFVWPNSWRDLVAKIQHFWLESGVFFCYPFQGGGAPWRSIWQKPQDRWQQGLRAVRLWEGLWHNVGGRQTIFEWWISQGSRYVLRKGITDLPTRKSTCSRKGNAIFQPLIFRSVGFQWSVILGTNISCYAPLKRFPISGLVGDMVPVPI